MGNEVSTTRRLTARGRFVTDEGTRAPQSHAAYNRSSLAVDLATQSSPTWQPLPQLVPRPVTAAVMAGTPSFVGLDQATYRRDPAAKWTSAVIHVVAIAGLLWLGFKAKTVIAPITTPVDITLYAPPPPPKVLPVAPKMGGGGGGGAHQTPPPVRGNPPRIVAPRPVDAPQILRINNPKLAVEPSEMVKMPQNTTLQNLGMSNSPQIALASQGKGSGSGFGAGLGGGIGMGHGIGSGPGTGGGYGGGIMSVGGGVSAPVLLHSVEPEFTEQARQAGFQGSVAIQLIVDSQGNPQNVHVTRHLGMGLDEKAVEAVHQYRFKPAMYQGHPVAVQIIIDVDFHLH
ncbi:MAG: energy transducer TonB [Acidobacteriota bacterium]